MLSGKPLLDGGEGKAFYPVVHKLKAGANDRAANDTGKPEQQRLFPGLTPPTLESMQPVTGDSTPQLRKENKRRRRTKQISQVQPEWWTTHEGQANLKHPIEPPLTYRNEMCPRGMALHHPASAALLQYATSGCPTLTGKNWTPEQMQAAISRGPHISALVPDAMKQLDLEVAEKVKRNQARLVRWNDIRENPPKNLKISPVAMVPHQSRPYRAILDLSFPVKLSPSETVPSVNSTTQKSAPQGAIDQLGHVLPRIIHAFASTDDDATIFMAKWDIKDGFWRLDCEAGEEWNFSYVLPSSVESGDIILVVPTSLQMGWIESPPYFCVASETARDVAATYAECKIGDRKNHQFLHHTQTSAEYQALPAQPDPDRPLRYIMEVYMDDFITLAIATAKCELDHLASATMDGIHDVFPPAADPTEDPISNKKLEKKDGEWASIKDILGMTFDGNDKTIWLSCKKRDSLLETLRTWIRKGSKKKSIPFAEFQSTLSKLQHAFLTIPAGRGLLSPFYKVLAAVPTKVLLHTNEPLRNAVLDCRTFLRETISSPTKCRNLVPAWPDYVGITDASGHGLGGVIIGENKAVPSVVFRMQWPTDISRDIVSDDNPDGRITNSDLELAGLLMLWLVMEEVCAVRDAHIALFSDNSPTVHWVERMAAKHSKVAMQLLRALALRLQLAEASPLIPLHIAGVDNAMTDIPSRSFGSEPKWHCKTDTEFLTLFNLSFPLPNQESWTVYRLSSKIAMRVISILRTQVFTADEWRRLPKKGKLIGTVGSPTHSLWEWTHIYKKLPTHTKFEHCQDSRPGSDPVPSVADAKSKLERSIALSLPLARRFPWPEA